jgi:NO-binding membrane sensor protein with MHYT domain/signal transduction histidine kinase/ActR/RegA family two-component response regulator
MTPSDQTLVGSYDYRLVTLSVVIAIVAAYAALDLAGRVTSAQTRVRFVWLTGGSFAMGIGIWSMHYIGMLAFRLPIPVLYDWPTVLLSLLAAVLASASALFVVSRKKMGLLRASIGSIFMGGGIAAMHYVGMAAMRLSAMCQWSPALVALSVVLAVGISFVALLLTFYFRGDLSAWSWLKISSAVVMGAAIPIMHYTGMAAATFTVATPALSHSDTAHAVSVSSLSIAGIIVVTFLVLGIAVLTSLAGRRFSMQAVELEASAHLAAIVESSDDAIISKTLAGDILTWNSGAERMFGYSAQEAQGKKMMIARGERVAHLETTRRRKDGRHIDVSVTISPVRDRQGKIVGASNIVRDITERKVAEARVNEQLSRLSLLNQITRAIGGREDLDSIYQVALRSLEEDLGFDFGCICDYDPISRNLQIIHVGARSRTLAMELALTEQAHIPIDANGLSRCVLGKFLYEPDIAGVILPFPQKLAAAGLRSLVAAPLLVESKVFGVFVAARREPASFSSGECDFLRQLNEHVALAAHQAQLYASLQQAYDDLRQTQQAVMQQERLRALGQMASGIAHDINNAISPMWLSTEMLLETDTDLSPQIRKHLEMIQRATGDVAHTVARMTEFYRQRELQLTLSPVDINALVQQVMDLTRVRWSDMPQRQGIVIEMRTELEQNPPAIMGVESEIREALINLIFNAIDAMPSGGVLTLRTRIVERSPGRPKLSSLVVEVADNGVGMDEETRRRCLEPFFTTKGERGTGLGLAMVYGVVQRQDADLEIDSTAGMGTTVRLSFAVPVGGATNLAPETPRPIPSRARILVVDDDPLIIRVLCEVLERDGHEVTAANGGKAGIDAFSTAQRQGKPFAVVITDLGMPRIDGRKVASFVKSASQATPVILLTGWGQRLIAEGDVSPHVDRVLSKPTKIGELREALALCLPPRERELPTSRIPSA